MAYASATRQVPKRDEEDGATFVSPAFFVKKVEQKKEANMKLAYTKVEINGMVIDIPTLTNSKALKGGDELALFLSPGFPQPPAAKKARIV